MQVLGRLLREHQPCRPPPRLPAVSVGVHMAWSKSTSSRIRSTVVGRRIGVGGAEQPQPRLDRGHLGQRRQPAQLGRVRWWRPSSSTTKRSAASWVASASPVERRDERVDEADRGHHGGDGGPDGQGGEQGPPQGARKVAHGHPADDVTGRPAPPRRPEEAAPLKPKCPVRMASTGSTRRARHTGSAAARTGSWSQRSRPASTPGWRGPDRQRQDRGERRSRCRAGAPPRPRAMPRRRSARPRAAYTTSRRVGVPSAIPTPEAGGAGRRSCGWSG